MPLDWIVTQPHHGDNLHISSKLSCYLCTLPLSRTEQATSVLLADPCFQLRSICYLLGQPEPLAPGTALPAPDRKRFSLQSCKWARGGSGKSFRVS